MTRVSSGGRFDWSIGLRANGPIARARGSLWVSTGDELTGRQNAIVRLAPADGHVTGRSRSVGARRKPWSRSATSCGRCSATAPCCCSVRRA